MNSTPTQTRSFPASLLPLFLCCAVSAAAISNQSFWIDEGCNAWKASQPTLKQWWHEMVSERGSDLQMPLYMIYSLAWEKVGGHGEWWLRAANIPFLLIGVFAWGRRWQLVALLSPFLWYYLNEARPYAMQIGSSLLIFGSMLHLASACDCHSRRRWSGGLVTGLVLLSGSSLLGMIWAAAAMVAFVSAIPWSKARQLAAESWGIWTLTFFGFCVLAGYYLYTLKIGAGASKANTTDIRNVVFVFYELFGFSGVGPGRLEIRTSGTAAFRPYLWTVLAYGIPLASLLFVGIRETLRYVPRRVICAVVFALGGAILFLIAAGIVKHFRVLGRHFTPLFPVIFWIIAMGASICWKQRSILLRTCLAWFLIASLASSLLVRFAPRHAKDDYRGACVIAEKAIRSGNLVWWSGDIATARFYGLTFNSFSHTQTGSWAAINKSKEDLKGQIKPQFIIASEKEDLYDNQAALKTYLAEQNFHLIESIPSFKIWRNLADTEKH